jgi:Double zinc ribbon
MNTQKSRFKEELGIISPIAVGIAIAGFVGMPVLFACLPKGPHDLPPFPGWLILGILAGVVLAAWVLLIGYINADAGRRGMGRTLWTFIAILVPNCLGILAYFLLRKPKTYPCPGCGVQVSPDFRFCAKCGFALAPVCAHCGRAIQHDFVCCPYCGKPAAAAATS